MNSIDSYICQIELNKDMVTENYRILSRVKWNVKPHLTTRGVMFRPSHADWGSGEEIV